jgi:hypothetical protein
MNFNIYGRLSLNDHHVFGSSFSTSLPAKNYSFALFCTPDEPDKSKYTLYFQYDECSASLAYGLCTCTYRRFHAANWKLLREDLLQLSVEQLMWLSTGSLDRVDMHFSLHSSLHAGHKRVRWSANTAVGYKVFLHIP